MTNQLYTSITSLQLSKLQYTTGHVGTRFLFMEVNNYTIETYPGYVFVLCQRLYYCLHFSIDCHILQEMSTQPQSVRGRALPDYIAFVLFDFELFVRWWLLPRRGSWWCHGPPWTNGSPRTRGRWMHPRGWPHHPRRRHHPYGGDSMCLAINSV